MHHEAPSYLGSHGDTHHKATKSKARTSQSRVNSQSSKAHRQSSKAHRNPTTQSNKATEYKITSKPLRHKRQELGGVQVRKARLSPI
ncbi:hypothetical protein THAOC_14324 [Thalassiosira oceanica]|uniref:Uncharacterized protein n=1 Tax=Thalassiosira oceanica TaxID=159749 RepID=K0SHP9_THAOC|nr:hypothetical protein THAOC_14324 [Thalassiosira oceanica]|eukprot:EJK64890.1 hypothetical protein THAOC_14324 [Thalassiosira oceanica]